MYKDMAKLLKDDQNGDFSIRHFTISENNYRSLLDGISPGEYVQLRRNGVCVMSNTPMEQRTNWAFCQDAHGDVLIGGLGIGMVIMAIQDKEEVTSITVVGKHQEVIEMLKKQLPFNNKVTVIHDDVFTFKPTRKYDCIYMDIWDFTNSDVYQEMVKLKHRYGRYLKPKDESPKRFNRCWAEEYAKNNWRLV